MSGERNVYQLLHERDVHSRLREEDIPYRVLGGIAAHAILNARIIHWNDRVIEIDPESNLSTMRDNGTQRDIDTLVVTPETDKTNEAKDVLDDAVDGYLSVSVFGLRRRVEAKKTLLPNMDFVSHRTIDGKGSYYIELDTVETELPQSWYEEWEVRTPDDESPLFTTLSSIAIEAGYRMRSITGVRPKDREKLQQLQEKVCMDGRLSDTQLTDDLIAHYNAQKDAGLVHARSVEDKRNKPYTWFRSKALILGHLERQPQIVGWAQSRLEPILAPFVGRK